MTETDKIAQARVYMEKLANGINPLTNQVVPDADLMNNVRISRCFFFYVVQLLKDLEEQANPVRETGKSLRPRSSGTGGQRYEAGGADQYDSPGTEARFLPGGSRRCTPEREDLLRAGASVGDTLQGVPSRQFRESRIQSCRQRQRRQS